MRRFPSPRRGVPGARYIEKIRKYRSGEGFTKVFAPVVEDGRRRRCGRQTDDSGFECLHPVGMYGDHGGICGGVRKQGREKSHFLRGQAHADRGAGADAENGRYLFFFRHDVCAVFENGRKDFDQAGFRHGDRGNHDRASAQKGVEVFYVGLGDQKQRQMYLRDGGAAGRVRGDARNPCRKLVSPAAGHAEGQGLRSGGDLRGIYRLFEREGVCGRKPLSFPPARLYPPRRKSSRRKYLFPLFYLLYGAGGGGDPRGGRDGRQRAGHILLGKRGVIYQPCVFRLYKGLRGVWEGAGAFAGDAPRRGSGSAARGAVQSRTPGGRTHENG